MLSSGGSEISYVKSNRLANNFNIRNSKPSHSIATLPPASVDNFFTTYGG